MPRYRLIACEVFYREFEAVRSNSPHQIDCDYVEQGLHDLRPETMSKNLQARIDAIDADTYDAILLGYGLCNNGISGLHAKDVPIVVPRAHDCITLFLGSLERYEKIFKESPGSYYLSSGWIERANRPIESLPTHDAGDKERSSTYQHYVDKFGEENAQYLMETLGNWSQKYGRMVYISLGVGDEEQYRAHTKKEAEERGLKYEEIQGDLSLFEQLINGPNWDPEAFLVLEPGSSLKPVYDGKVISCTAAHCPSNATCTAKPEGTVHPKKESSDA